MPAVEAQQPEVQQMELPSMNGPITEQPRQNEGMSADPVSMRGGGLFEACLECYCCVKITECCC